MAPLDERIVQAIWNEQLLKSDVLVTADGRAVKVFDAGQWNGEAGPDFRNADVSIGGQRFRGDVEIHVYATDWEKHGHQRDFDYNGVVLHVVLYRDDALTRDELHNGSQVPRLVLEDFVEPDLETIRLSMAGEDFFHAQRSPEVGPGCHLEVARVEDGYLCELMDEAARERMETRVERYAHQASTSSLDQALYQALMTSMGHKGGKTLFFLLARRAPLDDLRLVLRNVPAEELPQTLEAILLHVSGLASHRAAARPAVDMLAEAGEGDSGCEGMGGVEGADPGAGAGTGAGAGVEDWETAAYITRMELVWGRYERFFADRVIPPTRRWMTGIRPVNFPTRRIAGMARFLATAGFHGSLTGWFADMLRASAGRGPRTAKDFKKEVQLLMEPLLAGDLSYWSHRYTMGGRRTEKPMALIGEERALSMLFNAILPVMLLHARHMGDDVMEKHLWRIHDNFGSLQANTITKFMRARLFGAGPARPGLNFRLEKHNQALIHIFHQCCSDAGLTCEECVFRQAARLRRT